MIKYETQPYKVILRFDGIEVRYYPPAMKVRTVSLGENNRNFSALFGYISGNNLAKQKIAMTTPVYRSREENTYQMTFVLPSKYNVEAPEPVQDGVEVFRSPPGYFAALSYGGYSNREKEAAYSQQLLGAIRQKGMTPIGAPLVLSYDAPYKFYNRLNEILIEVEASTFTVP